MGGKNSSRISSKKFLMEGLSSRSFSLGALPLVPPLNRSNKSLLLLHQKTTWDKALSTKLSAFRPRGVPGPTSKLSPRFPSQMGRREMEHEGGEKGETGKRGNPRPSCCPAPRSGALAVGVTSVRVGESEELYVSARPPARPTLP
jgi:hypothetical protein